MPGEAQTLLPISQVVQLLVLAQREQKYQGGTYRHEDGHSTPASSWIPVYIGEDSHHRPNRGTGEYTREKAEHQKERPIRRERAGESTQEEGNEGIDRYVSSTVLLAEGGPEKWPLLRVSIKVSWNLTHIGGKMT